MTSTDAVPTGTNLYYRRAADSTITTNSNATYAWNFAWPGRYNGYGPYNGFGPKNRSPIRAGGVVCVSILPGDRDRPGTAKDRDG